MNRAYQEIFNFSVILIGITFLNSFSFSKEVTCSTLSKVADRCEGILNDYHSHINKLKEEKLKHNKDLEDFKDMPSYGKFLNESNSFFSEQLANEKKSLRELFSFIILLSDDYKSAKECEIPQKTIGKCFIDYYKIVPPISSDQPSSDIQK